eukprot:scaffold93296_cov32-Tisochrysis_lutea.AAC.4
MEGHLGASPFQIVLEICVDHQSGLHLGAVEDPLPEAGEQCNASRRALSTPPFVWGLHVTHSAASYYISPLGLSRLHTMSDSTPRRPSMPSRLSTYTAVLRMPSSPMSLAGTRTSYGFTS